MLLAYLLLDDVGTIHGSRDGVDGRTDIEAACMCWLECVKFDRMRRHLLLLLLLCRCRRRLPAVIRRHPRGSTKH